MKSIRVDLEDGKTSTMLELLGQAGRIDDVLSAASRRLLPKSGIGNVWETRPEETFPTLPESLLDNTLDAVVSGMCLGRLSRDSFGNVVFKRDRESADGLTLGRADETKLGRQGELNGAKFSRGIFWVPNLENHIYSRKPLAR
jgi:hypothetical protein